MSSQGGNNYIVPSCVSTFMAPRSADKSAVISLSSPVLATIPCDASATSFTTSTTLLSGPLLQQPFDLCPGFFPVLAKTVNQIMSGKFVDLSNLLSANIVHTEPESRSIGCLVCYLTSFFSLNRPSPYIVLMLSYIFSINVVY